MRRLGPNILPGRARQIWRSVQSSTGSGGTVTVTVRCKLVTPMYGGGVTAGKVDRDMPIRASALRGHLRFWWRLLNDVGQPASELFDDESDLWGGISSQGPRASRVTLQVKSAPVTAGDLITKTHLANQNPRGFPAYALIVQPRQNPSFLAAGYTFDLVLRFKGAAPLQRDGVIEALRWWASFAGVGARTRRGFGAVKATANGVGLNPVSPQEVGQHGGWMVMRDRARNATEAWSDAVDALQEFRQGVGVGRNPGAGNRPGRSRWPEADTIRRFVGTHAPQHPPKRPDPVDGFYPRAAFGLPLVFHFRDKDKGDPRPTHNNNLVLNPDLHERMASPLICRPWFDGQWYRPAALLLPGWEQRVSVHVRLGKAPATPAWSNTPARCRQLAQKSQPMHSQNATDALSAFMNYF